MALSDRQTDVAIFSAKCYSPGEPTIGPADYKHEVCLSHQSNLSFLFYQASTKPNPNAHLSDEVPSLSISDGTDGFSKLTADTVNSGIGAIKSNFGNISDIEMPDLSKPKQMVSDMASNFTNHVNDKAAQLKETVNNELSELQPNRVMIFSRAKPMVVSFNSLHIQRHLNRRSIDLRPTAVR